MAQHTSSLDPSFGSYALKPGLEKLRHICDRIPIYGVRSAVRKLVKSQQSAPYDVTLFNGVKARMNPWGNVCEKRVFCGGPFFDKPEMTFLKDQLAKTADEPFVVVDIGANVGFYTLYLHAEAQSLGKGFRAIAIEPDPENGRRLRDNIAANEIGAERVTHVPFAVSDHTGEVRFHSGDLGNRGTARIGDGDGDVSVPARTLIDILSENDISRIDVLKIDVEGHEMPVLGHFFQNAPTSIFPTTIVAETVHNNNDLPDLLVANNYERSALADINAIFTYSGGTAS